MRILAVALSLALLFVWSLPGTIALRSLLLLSALAVVAVTHVHGNWRSNFRDIGQGAALPLALIATFSLWLMGQGIWLAAEPNWSLNELRGQLLPALLAFLLGLMLAPLVTRLATAIVIVFAVQAAIAIGHAVWHWFIHGVVLTKVVPLTGGKLEMSFVLNLLLAFLMVDLFCRATNRPHLLRLPLATVVTILLLDLAGSLLAGARNGIIGIVFLSVSAISLFIFDQRRRLGPTRTLTATLAIAAGVTALASLNYHADSRWQVFVETAPIAWDIDSHTHWINPADQSLPTLADGRLADESAYLRIAFIHGGLRLLADHPLGYGYGRNAFAHALRLRYPEARLGHAHSGWIDLGVGGGVPALLLWASFLGSLIWLGWRSYFGRNDAHGLTLFFIATGFAGRMVLDSVNKDHMLQMFLFLIGLLLTLTTMGRERSMA